MSRTAKLLKYLESGAAVTARQIEGSFGLKNPHRAVHYLRSKGNCIYSNVSKLSDGTETIRYRIGKPTKRMVAIATAVAGSSVFTRTA